MGEEMYGMILENKLKNLSNDLLDYSNETSDRIKNSTCSFLEGDVYLAKSIIESTSDINKRSDDIEQGCLKILGLHQPVARDLRLGAAVLRTSTELERINILSAYISRYAIDSTENDRPRPPIPPSCCRATRGA